MSMLVVGPLLLATFFALAGHGMVILRMKESKGGNCQPFFQYECSMEQRLWGSPQFKTLSSDVFEK